LSFRIQLGEGLFVKSANAVECKVPGWHLSDNTVPHLTERHFISKLVPSEKKSRLQRQCAVCQKPGKRKDTVHWCDTWRGTLCGMFSQLSHQARFLRLYDTIIHNFYTLTMQKIILK
jgi:hypothetical protein